MFPDVGIWHPAAPTMYEDLKEYLNWYDTRKDQKFAKDAPVVGLVLQRTHLVTGDEGHYASVVSELESKGAKVIWLFVFLCSFGTCDTRAGSMKVMVPHQFGQVVPCI